MIVYETDQWASFQVRQQRLTLADLEKTSGEVYGGDADSVRLIFGGGHIYRREIGMNERPGQARVWFTPDENGELRVYLANYDSSD